MKLNEEAQLESQDQSQMDAAMAEMEAQALAQMDAAMAAENGHEVQDVSSTAPQDVSSTTPQDVSSTALRTGRLSWLLFG